MRSDFLALFDFFNFSCIHLVRTQGRDIFIYTKVCYSFNLFKDLVSFDKAFQQGLGRINGF